MKYKIMIFLEELSIVEDYDDEEEEEDIQTEPKANFFFFGLGIGVVRIKTLERRRIETRL